jgi:hypothetical protein
MKQHRTLHADAVVIAVIIAAAAAWLNAGRIARPDTPVQVAQEEYGSPIGEYNGPIGGPTMYGEDVGNGPIGGPTMYGEAVGNGPIGGPSMYGEAVGNGPIGGPSMYGAPVGDDAPIGGDTLY